MERRGGGSNIQAELGENGLLREGLNSIGSSFFILAGGLLFLVGNIYVLFFNSLHIFLTPLGLVNIGFYAILGAITASCGIYFTRSDISTERTPRAAAWMLCAVVALILLNVPIMVLLSGVMSHEYLVGWIISVVGTGGAAGAVVGVMEARSIERAHANQQLFSERRAAEHHADQLDYLNSVLRHEVLNNVSIIKGYAAYALEEQTDPTRELEVIRAQSEEMAEIITDVRVLIESLQGTYTLEEYNLSSVIRDELEKVRAMTDRDIEIEATIPDEVGVMADDLLARVFRNLFSNAIEHNDKRVPRLTVRIEELGDTVSIRVADNGPGIPSQTLEKLFERSQRADHGLGLYLVYELVQRYGGAIELVESGLDGSEFIVTLNRIYEKPA